MKKIFDGNNHLENERRIYFLGIAILIFYKTKLLILKGNKIHKIIILF